MVVCQKFFLLAVLAAVFSCGFGSAQTHTVRPTENLYRLSLKYGRSMEQLAAYNRISDKDRLNVGAVLKIPPKDWKPTTSAAKVSAKVTKAKSRPRQRAYRIILDPGHGGRDRGASYSRVDEADLNMKVAKDAEGYLEALGYQVTFTRRSDSYVSLRGRAAVANRYKNALFVSIHFNAAKNNSRVRGGETFYCGKRASYLASSIQRYLCQDLQLRDRGIKYRRLSVLRLTDCPAVLVECGFMSNPSELARCKTRWYQRAAARAIVKGIQRYDRRY